MFYRKIVVLIGLMTLVMVSFSLASEHKASKTTIPKDDIEHLAVDIDLGAGEFIILPRDMDDIAIIDVEYNPNRVKIITEYEKDENVGYLELESKQRRKSEIDTEDNFWNVILSTKYSTDLEIDLGACKAELDLGGIPIEMIGLDIGAAKGSLVFSKSNPINAEEIFIDAGVADFKISKLGNADFSYLEFDGGLGKFSLDFSGEYKRKSRAKLSIGMGTATLYIPADLPIRIDADDNLLSSIEFINADDIDIDDDYYESPDYESSDVGLSLKIEVGMAVIEIIFGE